MLWIFLNRLNLETLHGIPTEICMDRIPFLYSCLNREVWLEFLPSTALPVPDASTTNAHSLLSVWTQTETVSKTSPELPPCPWWLLLLSSNDSKAKPLVCSWKLLSHEFWYDLEFALVTCSTPIQQTPLIPGKKTKCPSVLPMLKISWQLTMTTSPPIRMSASSPPVYSNLSLHWQRGLAKNFNINVIAVSWELVRMLCLQCFHWKN